MLQYLTRSALSRVESRHIRVFRLFTFPAFLSKTRQYTQDFIVPSNFHHNLDSGCQRRGPMYSAMICKGRTLSIKKRNEVYHLSISWRCHTVRSCPPYNRPPCDY